MIRTLFLSRQFMSFLIVGSIAAAVHFSLLIGLKEIGGLAPLPSTLLGFIGGMDIPLIRNFSCGYAQGAKATDAKIDIVQNMVGTTTAAWNDPAKGGELARAQIERGVDVIFAAAGGSVG